MQKIQQQQHSDGCPIDPVISLLKLVVQVTEFRSGRLLEDHTGEDLLVTCDSVSKFCSSTRFRSMSLSNQTTTIKLVCKIWTSFQDRDCLDLKYDVQKIVNIPYENPLSRPALLNVIATDLLPNLEEPVDQKYISNVLVSSAADIAKDDPDAALQVIFSVVSFVPNNDGFDLFGRMEAFDISNVRVEQQERLYESCLVDLRSVKWQDSIGRISVAVRSAPFLTILYKDDLARKYRKTSSWLMSVLKIQSSMSKSYDLVIVKALALESLSFLSSEVLLASLDSTLVRKTIMDSKLTAEQLLLDNTSNVWALRGVAALVPLLLKFSIGFNVEEEKLFDFLLPNLRDTNHFTRLYSLQILNSFPTKIFVVDHADLDLEGDLDEEESFRPTGDSVSSKHGPVGQCDVLQTLLKLESSPVCLSSERELLSYIGEVEILARSGRLPALYAEAALNHMFGIFHVKYAPIWPAAQKAIVALAAAHESTVWPSFEAQLVATMESPVGMLEAVDTYEEEEEICTFEKHLNLCQRWETSKGTDVSLFGDSTLIVEGEVPRYHVTDEVTVMGSVWKSGELAHRVVVRHSRVIVPLFLRFLQNQLFSFPVYRQDALELHLDEVIEEKRYVSLFLLVCFCFQRLKLSPLCRPHVIFQF